MSIKTPVRHGSADRWTIFDANGEHILDSWATSDMGGEQVAAAVVAALNSLAARDAEVAALQAENQRLRELLRAARPYMTAPAPRVSRVYYPGNDHVFTLFAEIDQQLQTAIGGEGDNRDT